MDSKRAREIVDSLGVISVEYQGEPVWIESIDGDLAQVKNLVTSNRAQVSLDELTEE